MITADELRKQWKKSLRNRAMEFLNNNVQPVVMDAANKSKRMANFHIPHSNKYEDILPLAQEILSNELGYDVTINDNKFEGMDMIVEW